MIFPEISMTHCPTEDVLLDYVAGKLGPEQTLRFEEHAATCASCAALQNAQVATWRELEAWKPEPVSEGFNRELWRRIDADAAAGSRGLAVALRLNLWKRIAPLAVAMAALVAAFVLDHPGKPTVLRHATTTAAIVVTASDADQLERALDDIQLLHEVDSESAPLKKASAGKEVL
jgi:anti-sigma factor RsiW